ncbi:DUF6123 family protein [Aquibacillus salsiterrae]|uniref:DUF6123 family protein n=1 Tax=Aquibacillus salsiterrae TaxID=2950439 RepID=A0A9X4ADH0_9BACI|nr:DUF6123 family protein [Aquibacillus salsiterrae]MDC3415331.1 DUF6123 family protein [Aquibacillus salsiterrae]
MGKIDLLANYIEDLWAKGFKLADEEVQFIYFGRKYTNAADWKVILSIRVTLQFQQTFDGSFYLSLLELFTQEPNYTYSDVNQILKEKGLLAIS